MVRWECILLGELSISKLVGRNLVSLFMFPNTILCYKNIFSAGLGIDLLCVSYLYVSFLCNAYLSRRRTQRWILWKLLWISANDHSGRAIFSRYKMYIPYYLYKSFLYNENYKIHEIQHNCQLGDVLQKKAVLFVLLLGLPSISKAKEYLGIVRQSTILSTSKRIELMLSNHCLLFLDLVKIQKILL